MGKYKCYVVWVGRCPGVYYTWDECYAQVNGFSGARYKGFTSIEDANDAFRAIATTNSTFVTYASGVVASRNDVNPYLNNLPQRATPIVMHHLSIIVILFIIVLLLFVILIAIFIILVRAY